jgi:hypothetical protein
MGTPI